MSDIISMAEHEKRVRFKVRIQIVAVVAAGVALLAFGINSAMTLNSAVLGGVGLAGLGVAIITAVWSRIYGMIIIAKNPGPPNLR